jgi:hypothetical protein
MNRNLQEAGVSPTGRGHAVQSASSLGNGSEGILVLLLLYLPEYFGW